MDKKQWNPLTAADMFRFLEAHRVGMWAVISDMDLGIWRKNEPTLFIKPGQWVLVHRNGDIEVVDDA